MDIRNVHLSDSAQAVGAPELVRHLDLWFPDGSIVLKAETTLFKVHTSLLARRSLVFKDMLRLPQPARITAIATDSTPTYIDDCPLLELYDPAYDLGNLLKVLYDGPTYGNNDRADFRFVSGILRLSTKYLIDSIRAETIAHLSIAWPMTLEDWDTREDLAGLFEMETGVQRAFRYPSPIDVINLAREENVKCLLPSAFYDLSRYQFTQIFEQASDDDLHALAAPTTLSAPDLRLPALGKEAAQQYIPSLIQSMGDVSMNERDSTSVHFRSHRNTAARAMRRGRSACLSTTACRKEFAELVQLATQHYLFDREKGCADPLYVAEELGQLKSAEFSECEVCASALESWAVRERVRIWKLIPSWFRLDV